MRSILRKFSPAPANDPMKALDCAQTADCGAGSGTESAGNPLWLRPTHSRQMRRKLMLTQACAALSGYGFAMTFALGAAGAHWAVIGLASAASGFLLMRSHFIGGDIMWWRDNERIAHDALIVDAMENAQTVAALTQELINARREANLVYTAYLFAAARMPAEGEAGADFTPSADVIYLNGNLPPRRDN